ncbi:hypothetical protein SOVF_199890 isoform B [Spinacia oleracea]|nr:hypothetical protein SOVF_199890 isoform B [Spinacia oleracea]
MSSRARSSSPYSNHRRTPSPFSSSSSTSSFMNTSGRFIPRSNSTSSSSFPGSTGNNNSTYGSRSMTPNRTYGGHSPVAFSPSDDLLSEPSDPPRSTGDSISVTVRFRPMSDREYQRGDEVSWYPDGDKTVRSEYSPATCAYAFDKVFGPNATTEEVYDIAARPVVKSSMDGVNGTVFAYGVTSSGKTHTMHGDQSCPGIIPLAIKDVFSIIQETPGREFLLRVSYLEIYNEVINDLLDPTGQNLRVREDAQGTYVEGIKEEVVLSPGHALSFIAAGEEHRHVGSNNFNLFSSRSHTIFSLSSLALSVMSLLLLHYFTIISLKLELGDSENNKDSSSALSDPSVDFKHKRSSSKWNDELSAAGSILMESNQDGEFISGSNLTTDDITASDEMDLLVEQVKMLAGEIAFSTSTLKRLVEQSANDPDAAQSQIHNLECEIQDKRKQMRLLEQRIIQSGEASVASASLLDMQQTVTRLKTECSQKEFELELKTADNRILQEQLQNKCAENIELLERLNALEKHVTSVNGDSSLPSVLDTTDEYTEELKKKVQSQEMENEKLKLEHVQLLEENSGLCVQNQKLSEEASYAKELASAAAVELKNLAAEVTKISVQNAKLEKELLASREYSHTRGSQISNGGNRKHGDGMKGGRKGRYSSRGNDVSGGFYDDSYSLDLEDLKMELLARKQREAALEAALADKEFVEEECRTKVEEAKRREVALENDLANMWVLVAKLKKEVGAVSESRSEERLDNGDILKEQKATDVDNNGFSKETQPLEVNKAAQDAPSGEPLVARLKARMQEMKDKEKSTSNGETNSHLCKVCYESPTAAILLPCRHFCLCKPCSLACSECPICRTNIADRIFAFTS